MGKLIIKSIVLGVLSSSSVFCASIEEARAAWRVSPNNFHFAQDGYKDILGDQLDQSNFAVVVIGGGHRGLNPLFVFPEVQNFFMVDFFDEQLIGWSEILANYDATTNEPKEIFAVKKHLENLGMTNIVSNVDGPYEKYVFNAPYKPELERTIHLWRADMRNTETFTTVVTALAPLELKAVVFSGAVPYAKSLSLLPLIAKLKDNRGYWIDEAGLRFVDGRIKFTFGELGEGGAMRFAESTVIDRVQVLQGPSGAFNKGFFIRESEISGIGTLITNYNSTKN